MPIILVYTFGNMLIGMILGKLDFFRLPERLKKLTNRFIILGFSVGIISSYFFHQLFMAEKKRSGTNRVLVKKMSYK